MTTRRRSRNTVQIPSMSIIKMAVLVSLIFIGLKLANYTEIAHWSWFWVLSPIWLPLLIIVFLLLFLKWYEK